MNRFSRFAALLLIPCLTLPPDAAAAVFIQPSFQSANPLHSSSKQRFEKEALSARVAAAQFTGPARVSLTVRERIRKALEIDIRDELGNLKTLDAIREAFIKAIFPDKEKSVRNNNDQVLGTVFKYVNGLAVIPLLHLLMTYPSPTSNLTVMQYLSGGPKTLEAISKEFNPEDPEANMAYKNDMLQVLVQQGWMSVDGKDENMTFQLTEQGREIFHIAGAHREVLEYAANSYSHLENYYKYIRQPAARESEEGNALREFNILIGLSKVRWGISDGAGSAAAVQQLRELLDGVIMCPTIVALGMPQFATTAERTYVKDPSIHEHILESQLSGKPVDINTLAKNKGYNAKFLRAALDLVASQKPFGSEHPLATFDGKTFQFLDWGQDLFSKKGGFGVPTSYVKGSRPEFLKAMLFDSNRPFVDAIKKREHVDQPMNSWGAHLQHVQFLPDLLRIILILMEEGALGASEMGAGNGNNVATMAAVEVAWRMVRGLFHHAAGHSDQVATIDALPPVILSISDYDQKELAPRQAYTVEQLFGPPSPERDAQMRFVNVFGDITDPRAFAEDIARLFKDRNLAVTVDGQTRLIRIQDLVQMMMFVIEERDLQLNGLNPAKSAEILSDRIAGVEKEMPEDADLQRDLQEVLEDLHAINPGDPIPQGEKLREAIRDKLSTSLSDYGKFVPAEVGAAELILFTERLLKIAPLGFVACDVCTTVGGLVNQWLKPQPNTNYRFSHAFREHILPEPQRRLLYILAGGRIKTRRDTPPGVALVGLAHVAKREKPVAPSMKVRPSGNPSLPLITDGVWTMENGDTVGYAEYGDPQGLPVLYVPGSQGSRYELEMYDLRSLPGVRWIVIDRPGAGHSSLIRGREEGYTPADWALVARDFLHHHLGEFAEFGVVSYSGGSHFANAILADTDLAPRVIFTDFVSPAGPMDNEKVLDDAHYHRAVQKRYRMGRLALWTFVRDWTRNVLSDAFWQQTYEKFLSTLSTFDRAVMSRQIPAAASKKSWQQTHRFGARAWFGETVAAIEAWMAVKVSSPIHITHWENDTQVLPVVAHELVDHFRQTLPDDMVQLTMHPGGGHRGAIDHLAIIVRQSVERALEHRENSVLPQTFLLLQHAA